MASRLKTIESHLPTSGTSFHYTKGSNSYFSEENRKFYEHNGYFVAKGLLSTDDIHSFTKRFLDIAAGAPHKCGIVMRDVSLHNKKALGEENVTKVQDWVWDEPLFQYCMHPKIRAFTEAIIGPSFRAMHTMFINKPPDLGSGSSRHPPHQDMWYFPWRPAEKVVAAWCALEPVDPENGCLFVVPGSHRCDLFEHVYPNDGVVNKAYHGIKGLCLEEVAKLFPLVGMEAGDVVFFHPHLIHGSGRNLSGRFRKAICVHFAATDCHWFMDPLQRSILEETWGMYKKVAKATGDWTEAWRLWEHKSRLVQGVEGTLSKDFPPTN